MFKYSDYEILEFIRVLEESRPNFYWLALCRNSNTKEFFPGRGQSSKIKKAVEMCLYCPVQYECHEYAIDNKIEHGVWGGSTPEQRARWIQNDVTVHNAWLEITPGLE